MKKQLPVSLTASEARWGIRYLLFELVFLGSILEAVLGFIFPDATGVHLNFAYFFVNFLAVFGIFRQYLLESLHHTAKHLRPFLLAALAGFAVYELLSSLLSMGVSLLFPQFFNVNDASIAYSTRQNGALMAVGTVILVPIVEETLHRGLVFGLFRQRSRWMGYLVSTLLFCTIHVMNYVGSYEPLHLLLCFIQYIPAGLVLAWAYEFSGSIYAPTLIHMAVNAIGTLSMG